jgi:integrase
VPAGSAVIEYRGKRGNVYRIKYVDAGGVQVMETVGAERDGVTRRQAEAELRERLVRVDRKAYRRPKPTTFGEYAQTWFEEGQRRRGWKPRTVIAYRNALARLEPTFGRLPLASIRPRDVAAFVREQLGGYSPTTVSLDVNVLHNILKTAVREELLDANAAAAAERPKHRKRRWRILEPVEVGRVLRAFEDEQARTMFLTLVLTGVRRFELLALRWRDVDLVENILRVRQSKSEEGERAIALSPTLATALLERLERTAFKGADELVFCHSQRGSRVDHEWYAGEFRKALKAAGITDYVRPFHDARHASLTNGAAAGEKPLALMARAGHRSMATTNQYVHLAGVTFRDEAEALEERLLGARSRTAVTDAVLLADDAGVRDDVGAPGGGVADDVARP